MIYKNKVNGYLTNTSHNLNDELWEVYESETADSELYYQDQLSKLELLIDPFIMKPINDYNKANGLKFASPQNCKDWIDDLEYEHRPFCIKAWDYHRNIYKTARAFQQSATSMPTVDEFKAVLQAVVF